MLPGLPRLPRLTSRTALIAAGGAAVGFGLLTLLVANRSGAAGSSQASITSSQYGLTVLGRARGDLGITASGDPSRVAQMLANFGLVGSYDWCAAALGTWVREAAAQLGVDPPISGSASVLTTVDEFETTPAGGWIPAANLSMPMIVPGTVVAWSRGGAGSGLGHIGVVSRLTGGTGFTSVEGNAQGGAVVENTHDLADSPTLLGLGYFTDALLRRIA